MSRIKEQILRKTAQMIYKSAVRGAGRASELGIYQPKRPEGLIKK